MLAGRRAGAGDDVRRRRRLGVDAAVDRAPRRARRARGAGRAARRHPQRPRRPGARAGRGARAPRGVVAGAAAGGVRVGDDGCWGWTSCGRRWSSWSAGLPAPDLDADVRLWVDRAFTVRGAGTVVTGTLGAGTMRVGDELALGDRTVIVRGMQALGESVDPVRAVARVALNLRGVGLDEVGRGDALTTPGRWLRSDVVDVRVGPPRGCSAAVDLPKQVMLHVGSAAVAARVRPLSRSGAPDVGRRHPDGAADPAGAAAAAPRRPRAAARSRRAPGARRGDGARRAPALAAPARGGAGAGRGAGERPRARPTPRGELRAPAADASRRARRAGRRGAGRRARGGRVARRPGAPPRAGAGGWSRRSSPTPRPSRWRRACRRRRRRAALELPDPRLAGPRPRRAGGGRR